MPFIPKDERPALARLAGLRNEQASELSGALSAASDELDGDELVQHVINGTPSVEADDVKRILSAVRQVASAKELLDRENTYCRARIISDLRPIFGSNVRQSPKAVLVAHMLRITYHHGSRGTLKDLFLTLRTEDLDQLSELIERARSKADSLHAFTAAADLREIN